MPLNRLRRLVIKELVDNALDAYPGGKKCVITKIDEDTYSVADVGTGILGTPEQIAHLFSIKRPLMSSKVLRRPSRGALGNGIRVIAGVILASGGELMVETRGKQIKIRLLDDGTSEVESAVDCRPRGTVITVKFGPAVPRDPAADVWGKWANDFSQALVYKGKSNPWWYDSDSFFELCQAATVSTTELVQMFDGQSSRNVMQQEEGFPSNPGQMSREDCDRLLEILRADAQQVDPKDIGRIYDKKGDHPAYHRAFGTLTMKPGRGYHNAFLPFVVEAMCRVKDDQAEKDDDVFANVNGTPITGDMTVQRRGKGEIVIWGCGLQHFFRGVSSRKFQVDFNITIPYMPITTDGKAPDYSRFLSELQECIQKASRKLRSQIARGRSKSDVLERHIKEAIDKASGNGRYRFSLRQLYYAIRPYIMEKTEDGTLDYTYFGALITKYEAEAGEIPGMYRDPRGVLYHPHTGQTIPIGTIAVEEYERPKWTFNKVLYIEKEGLFEVLKQARFPERYDCALLSSKGYASRAVRDLIDLLGETEEEIHVFCIHDADGPGTVIYQSLVESTGAREARKIKVHNLGLEPWEGLEMGLQVETFGERKQKVPVANYVNDRDDEHDENWARWLQTQRIELNAMTSPQFLGWIEGKFDELEAKKVIPPRQILESTVFSEATAEIRQRVAADILKRNGFERLVQERVANIVVPDNVRNVVADSLEQDPTQRWSSPVKTLADKLADKAME